MEAVKSFHYGSVACVNVSECLSDGFQITDTDWYHLDHSIHGLSHVVDKIMCLFRHTRCWTGKRENFSPDPPPSPSAVM